MTDNALTTTLEAVSSVAARSARALLPTRDVHRPVDTDALLHDPQFQESLAQLAKDHDEELDAATTRAAACLQEMSAMLDPAAHAAWRRLGHSLLRAYDIVADEAALARLRELDREHSLVWLASHRSYLDTWAAPGVLESSGLSFGYAFGGANLNFFPFGQVARRTGMIFVRRSTKDDPVYRLALRSYVGELVRNRENLGWAIEGGRTRTGKLRPPRYGLLRYLMDGAATVDGPEILLVPVSIVYDQLHEVSLMTGEARGLAKRPEDIRWFLNLARQQRQRLGHVYLDIGEPVPLRERMAAPEAGADESHDVERIALEVCHRLNQATPVTLTAMVALALLASDRALTFDEVVETVEPTARYLRARGGRVAGGISLTDRSAVRRTLRELTASGVLTMFDGVDEAVWSIAPGQHLVAAFYRNTAIHLLVNRAIGELALLTATEDASADAGTTAYRAALDLRELLKFDFFFAGRAEFAEDMRTEMSLIDPNWETEPGTGEGRAGRWLAMAQPLVAHLALRPFLDAYLVVAERLAARESVQAFDERGFLDECLRAGHQWVLQRKLANDESVSLELFRPALRLARHRDLLGPGGPELNERRTAFVEEIRAVTNRLAVIADTARSKGETG
ncbi:MAG TPA: lysophospholipid acyltransferase [Aldersonia sp.]